MIVVADTSPINYLILINEIHILSLLFREVFLPPAVLQELLAKETPDRVKAWVSNRPNWAIERAPGSVLSEKDLGPGESEAISLATELHCGLIMDDMRAATLARETGLQVVGTLGILQRAHARGHCDIRQVLEDLIATSFHISTRLFEDTIAGAIAMKRRRSGDD
jgi:predicted nucleic acid-binding protein